MLWPEARSISQSGHDFRPDYFDLPAAARAQGARQPFACTATALPRVAGDALIRLGLRDPACIITGFDSPNLSSLGVRSTNDADREQRIAGSPPRPASGSSYAGWACARTLAEPNASETRAAQREWLRPPW